ncbi:LicD family protein [Streptococcus respiraculi]|uniref:LicD family protein n=1 Tax=Streptococcus respiraculi TaxID=2021971 RepID=UPI000E74DDD1|nr:LicD family protein [Streptococcus respiraculi]
MDPVQRKMFQVYEEVKRICDENNLRYFAAGGTKIGAVLWQGIIPWDDDIDLVMPINDLEKLVDIIQNSECEDIAVFDGLTTLHSDILGIKVYDTHSMFTSNNLLNRPDSFTGIFVDIFPLIGAPNGDIYPFIEDIYEVGDALYRQRLFGTDELVISQYIERMQDILHRYSFDEAETILNVANPVGEHYPKEEFLDYQYFPFETSQIPVSKQYDSHLKQQYGFYTKDWPEEKRQHLHQEFALVDTEKTVDFYRHTIETSPIRNYMEKLWTIKSELEKSVFDIDDSRKLTEEKYRELEKEKEKLEAEMEVMVVMLKELESRHLSLLNSKSWKITQPLRAITNFIQSKRK